MHLRNAKIMVVAAIVLASVASTLTIRHQAKAKLRQAEKALWQRSDRFDELLLEYRRLTNRLTERTTASRQDYSAELQNLQSEANALRNRTNEIARQLANKAQVASEQTESGASLRGYQMPRFVGHVLRRGGNLWVISDSNSEEYAAQLGTIAAGERNRYTGDAANLGFALQAYARDHGGNMPSTFAEAEPYKFQGELPLAGTYKDRDTMAGVNDFEIVYHGSRNDITNIPEPAVAMIRQRTPWPTPNGKWGRIYTMMDGRVCIVESDDNFQSWEAQHIIPP